MFTAIISDDAGLLYVTKDDNREFCIQKEADVISETTVSASFVCICAVSSVLRCKIVSYYRQCGARGVKDLMNCMIEPREPCLLNDRIIHVLWPRDSNFDSRPGVRYHPNHFVPLFVVSGEAVRSEKLDPQTESRGQLKITSLLKNKNISTTLDRKPASTTSCIPANNSVSKPASKVEPSSSVKRKAVFDDSAQSKKRKTHAREPV